MASSPLLFHRIHVTKEVSVHIRDGMDLKTNDGDMWCWRCNCVTLFGTYNIGHQHFHVALGMYTGFHGSAIPFETGLWSHSD